jgi:NADPH:quinone reductase-like Zn-dependent oxidoreductase
MLAARIHNYGPITDLKIEEVPSPTPALSELLVQVAAAGVNPVDWKIASGGLRHTLPLTMPYTLGCDFAGTVIAVGEGAAGYSIGDRVFGYPSLMRSGAFAQNILTLPGEIALVPEAISLEDAAAIPVASITAYDGLLVHGKLTAGMKVLILGGSGGVGSAAVQIAKHYGAKVFATTSARNKSYVESLGATAIDYNSGSTADTAQDVDLILDCVGPEAGAATLPSLIMGGTYITTVYGLPAEANLAARNATPIQYGILPSSEKLALIAEIAAAGHLTMHIDRRFPLSQTQAALELSQAGRTRGKLLIIP